MELIVLGEDVPQIRFCGAPPERLAFSVDLTSESGADRQRGFGVPVGLRFSGRHNQHKYSGNAALRRLTNGCSYLAENRMVNTLGRMSSNISIGNYT